MKTKRYAALTASVVAAAWLPVMCGAQVSSGSNGSDGVFSPATNTLINMASRPSGIYQYTSVNISNGVTVTFIPNANNTPVVWLVQSNVTINGAVDVSANPGWGGWNQYPITVQNGGPGGYRGGNGGTAPSTGQGAGGGSIGGSLGGNASFGAVGDVFTNSSFGGFGQGAPGVRYGNSFLVPLLGGSGGGGSPGGFGGGGGGAILIAASGTITLNGSVQANGSPGGYLSLCYISGVPQGGGGAGSGGGIRLVASRLVGAGSASASGSGPYAYDCWVTDYFINHAGAGRVRFDVVDSTFSGSVAGVFTQGFQPVIIPVTGQGVQLGIASIGGVAVAATPSGVVATPDAVLSAQQANPIPVVVHCSNLPLNTAVTVTIRPVNGSAATGVGYNNAGTQASSTATALVTMPRGGGIVYATAATGN